MVRAVERLADRVDPADTGTGEGIARLRGRVFVWIETVEAGDKRVNEAGVRLATRRCLG